MTEPELPLEPVGENHRHAVLSDGALAGEVARRDPWRTVAAGPFRTVVEPLRDQLRGRLAEHLGELGQAIDWPAALEAVGRVNGCLLAVLDLIVAGYAGDEADERADVSGAEAHAGQETANAHGGFVPLSRAW